MERVNKILHNPKYINYVKRIERHEKNREFCRHNMIHFLDTARIMYILSLENKLAFHKEIIYACGLLHDIGRWLQYEKGLSHHKASAELAYQFLEDAEYSEDEIEEIIKAIEGHGKDSHEENSLCDIMYRADKLSRECYRCEAKSKCNWKDEKKNINIKY